MNPVIFSLESGYMNSASGEQASGFIDLLLGQVPIEPLLDDRQGRLLTLKFIEGVEAGHIQDGKAGQKRQRCWKSSADLDLKGGLSASEVSVDTIPNELRDELFKH